MRMQVSVSLGIRGFVGAALLALFPWDSPVGATGADFRIPEGFEIVEVASQDLAPDIFTMTISRNGRLTVAGRGYIRILKDDDGDGIADRAVTFSETPMDGAMGLWWEGDDLLVVGDGGLWRYRDADGDDLSDGPPERLRSLKTGGEHDSHAIRRGPDGWWYLLCGNESRVDSTSAELAASPVKRPTAGALLRISPDFSKSEILADGFRNAYDFDFDSEGEIFVYDSDNERDVSLPIYEPTRLYHVTPGFHYGWENPQLARTWRMPPYFYDVDRPIATLGRGSPTGVESSTGSSFPDRFRDGLFLADWTFGRVYYAPLRRSGSTYSATPEIFVQSLGTHGFAPTDLAVHPETGDLYISIGGRGTRGAVYRVRYEGGQTGEPSQPLQTRRHDPTEWDDSRGRDWLGAAWGGDLPDRLAALVAIRRFPDRFSGASLRGAGVANWDSPDRKVRQLTSKLIADRDLEERLLLFEAVDSATAAVTLAWGIREDASETAARILLPVLEEGGLSEEVLTDAIRLFQVLFGDLMALDAQGTVWEGCSRRGPGRLSNAFEADIVQRLLGLFPTGKRNADFELARTFGQVEADDPRLLEKVLAFIDDETSPSDDIHFLMAMGRLRAERSEAATSSIAEALLALDGKVTSRGWNRDRHWPWRLSEIYTALAEKDSNLDQALLDHPRFGAADHLVFVSTEGFPKAEAARRFLDLSRERADFEWAPSMVLLLEHVPPDEGMSVARELWATSALRDAVVRVLATHPGEEDREKFFHRLRSHQPETAAAALEALKALSPPRMSEEWMEILEAMRRLGTQPENQGEREEFVEYLGHASGLDLDTDSADEWAAALDSIQPGLDKLWNEKAAASIGDWKRRLARIDWERGQAEAGRGVYEAVGCAACHTGGKTLGPDLIGVARRFGREDLMTALLDPSRDIPSRYRTRVVETHDGELLQGLVVYEAVDSILLQNGPDTTYRIDADEVAESYSSNVSLMPTGLLDSLSDGEIADLMAYLASLE